MDKAKIDLIAKVSPSTSIKKLGVLGHTGFYRRFIKDFAKINPYADY